MSRIRFERVLFVALLLLGPWLVPWLAGHLAETLSRLTYFGELWEGFLGSLDAPRSFKALVAWALVFLGLVLIVRVLTQEER